MGLTNVKALIQEGDMVKISIGDETFKALGITVAEALARECMSGSIRQDVELKEDSMMEDIV
jgi:hypothetical protein